MRKYSLVDQKAHSDMLIFWICWSEIAASETINCIHAFLLIEFLHCNDVNVCSFWIHQQQLFNTSTAQDTRQVRETDSDQRSQSTSQKLKEQLHWQRAQTDSRSAETDWTEQHASDHLSQYDNTEIQEQQNHYRSDIHLSISSWSVDILSEDNQTRQNFWS